MVLLAIVPEEIYYGVPNVIAAMALVHCYNKEYIECKKLVDLLRTLQKPHGGWDYYDISSDLQTFIEYKIGTKQITEDSMHLCLIIYNLKEIEKISQIQTSDIVNKCLNTVERLNKNTLQQGSKGLGIPYLCLVMKNYNDEIYKKAYNLMVKQSIQHDNFRVRATCCWVLAKLFSD